MKNIETISLTVVKNKLLIWIFLILSIFFLTKSTFAQSATPEASLDPSKKHGIIYPIAELGNCTDLKACKTFCAEVSNKDLCINFAKKKGFYKEIKKELKLSARSSAILNLAKEQLGCATKDECEAFCKLEENSQKCADFGKKHNLGENKGKGNLKDRKLLERAKELLGCTSPESCKEICKDPLNQDKCSNFAKETGISGGIKKIGPGGCNSEESCKTYCQSNPEVCSKFQKEPNEKSAQNIKGPGGCVGPKECKAYCETHKDECKNFGQVVKDARHNSKDKEIRRPKPEGSFKPVPPPADDTDEPSSSSQPDTTQSSPSASSDSSNSGSGSSGSGSSGSGSGSSTDVRGVSYAPNFFQKILKFLNI